MKSGDDLGPSYFTYIHSLRLTLLYSVIIWTCIHHTRYVLLLFACFCFTHVFFFVFHFFQRNEQNKKNLQKLVFVYTQTLGWWFVISHLAYNLLARFLFIFWIMLLMMIQLDRSILNGKERIFGFEIKFRFDATTDLKFLTN